MNHNTVKGNIKLVYWRFYLNWWNVYWKLKFEIDRSKNFLEKYNFWCFK